MIIFRSPKGWTGPKEVDGLPVEGAFRSHQVPITDPRTNPAHLQQLEEWLRSYRPWELFNEEGRLISELAELAPAKEKRMGANPHANGGLLLTDLKMPDFKNYAIDIPYPGEVRASDTLTLGNFLRDVITINEAGAKLPDFRSR